MSPFRRLLFVVLLVGSTGIVGPAVGQVTPFDLPVDLWVPGGSLRSVVADLDGDGDRDFVTVYEHEFVVTINPGDMVLGSELQFSAPYPVMFGNVLAVDDLDDDGAAEILMTNHFLGASPFSILSVDANGDIVTSPLPAPTNNSQLHAVKILDFDDDGDKDIVAIGSLPIRGLGWFENTGGSFAAPVILQTESLAFAPLFTLEAADFNGDGTTDFAYALLEAAGERVRIFDPVAGTSTPVLPLVPDPPGSENIALTRPVAGDFNGDGAPDLGLVVRLNEFIIFPTATTGRLFLNDGSGSSFTEVANGLLSTAPYGAVVFDVGDVDGDGGDEIVTSAPTGTRVVQFDSTTPGGFVFEPWLEPLIDPLTLFCHDVRVTDVDQDIVTICDARLRVYLNRGVQRPNFRRIEVVSAPQSTTIGGEYPHPIVVRLLDRNGQPLAGEEIRVQSATGATLTPAVGVTDGNGETSFTAIAGDRPPVDRFRFFAYRAHPFGTPHEATVIATRAIEIVSGDGQTTPPGSPFTDDLLVRVTTLQGIPVVGASITFDILPPANEFLFFVSSSSTSATVTTDFDGFAAVAVDSGNTATVASITANYLNQVVTFSIATTNDDNPGTRFRDAPFRRARSAVRKPDRRSTHRPNRGADRRPDADSHRKRSTRARRHHRNRRASDVFVGHR